MKTAGALSLLGNLAGQGLLLRNGAWHPHRAPATSLPPATVLFGAKAAPDEVQSIFRAPSSWNLPYELMPHLVLPPSRPLPLGRNVTSLVEAMEEAAAEPAGPVMVIGPRGTPKNELGILAHYGFLVEEEEEGRTRELGVELKVPGEEPAAPLFVVDCALEKEQVEQTLFGVRLGRRGGRGLLKYMEMHRRQLLDSDAPPPSLLLTNCHAAPEGLCARVAESLSRQESPPKLILTSEYPLEAPEVRLTVSVSELVVRTPSSVARHLLKECWTYADPPTPPPLLTRSAAALDRHDWPGNDEELRATVVRAIGAAVTSRASNITSEFLFPVAAKEKERVRDLLPFMMPPTSWFPVWGKSRYSMDLRDAIQEAAADRRSRVLIVGEAGLHKTDIASLIHQLSAPVQTCATGKAGGLLLRVQFDGQPLNLETRMAPLLRALNASPLGDACTCATVILTDVQAVNQQDLARLLTSRAWTLNAADEEASGGAVAENRTYARFILTSSKRLPQLEEALKNARKAVRGVKLIKLAPLRARKMDLPDELDYAVNCAAAQLGVPRPRITQEALRAIEAFPFSKDNIRELESMVVRALVQLEPGAELTEETLWPSERYVTLQRLRWNLFRMLPELWKVARSPQWPEALNYGFTRWAFLAGVAVLWWGPQGRDDNFVLNLFWAWWWPLVLLTYPLVGRLWCSVCPFMIWGETWQRALVAMGAEMRTWPRKDDLAAWSPWIMFTLFSAILLWEQLWDLEHTANLSGWLLVLITAGSVTASTFFEKRLWCRHLCPIGGMNGLYSKLAMTELRSNRGICSANCSTYGCFKVRKKERPPPGRLPPLTARRCYLAGGPGDPSSGHGDQWLPPGLAPRPAHRQSRLHPMLHLCQGLPPRFRPARSQAARL
jgi:hypothetical protein